MNQIPSAAPYISIDERKMLMQHDNVRATIELVVHIVILLSAFYLIYAHPKIYVIIPALFIIGGRQLAFSILMHDSSHYSVYSNKKVNDFVGNWFGAHLVFNRMNSYRPYHKLHHLTTGTVEDPDLTLTRGYPTSKKSMMRKFTRDLFGITGLKVTYALILMALGYVNYTQSGVVAWTKKEDRKIDWMSIIGPLISNLILFLLLSLLFGSWMYLVWLLAYLTTFQLSVRVRSIAEHSVVDDPTDPNRNTRTTKANFIERLIFAPCHVNYHLEHHMLMTVPSYNLPKMHQLLLDRGFYNKGLLASGYWEVIKTAAQKLK